MIIGHFRKKPVMIKAAQFHRDMNRKDLNLLMDWCEGHLSEDGDTLQIPTLEGVMTAQSGDMIIQGVAGEFYPCALEIFKQTYDSVSLERYEGSI